MNIWIYLINNFEKFKLNNLFMKATEASLLEFIKKSNQFSIPIYQRLYSWTENECEKLWDDIITTGSKDIPSHFIGSIMYIEKGLYQISKPEPLLVIDIFS
jgi:uncharacterized protein with ParB-like and HNH nuclease domain